MPHATFRLASHPRRENPQSAGRACAALAGRRQTAPDPTGAPGTGLAPAGRVNARTVRTEAVGRQTRGPKGARLAWCGR